METGLTRRLWAAVDHDEAGISNAVRAVARHSHNPTERHWNAVLKIMEYLHGTRFLGLTFCAGLGTGFECV